MSNLANDEKNILIMSPLDPSSQMMKEFTAPTSQSSADFPTNLPQRRSRRIRNRLPVISIVGGKIHFHFREKGDCNFYAMIDIDACNSYAEYRKDGDPEIKTWDMNFERTSSLLSLHDILYKKDGDQKIRTWSDDEKYWLRLFRRKFGISLQYTAMLLGRTLVSIKRKCIHIEERTGEVI